MIDDVRSNLNCQLMTYVLKHSVEITPTSWWQHFKQDYFPRWALRRWPVRYNKAEVFIKHKPDMDIMGPVVRIHECISEADW